MRRWRCVAVLLVLTLLLSGCWSRMEVNDLAIVSMMALDKTEQGKIKMWLQIVIPSKAGGAPGTGGGGGGQPGPNFIVITSEGRTVLEASRQAQLQMARRIFWAHMRVILLGERLARSGARQVVDFLTRHRESRLNNYMLVVRGSMNETMAAQSTLEKLPGEAIREITHARVGTAVTVGDFSRLLQARGADPTLGVIEVSQPKKGNPEGQKNTYRLAGTALFHEDKLAGFMDEELTRGLLWLRGEAQQGVVTVKVPEESGYVSIEWVSSEVKRTARMEQGQVVVEIKAHTRGDISEESANLDLSKPKFMKLVEQEMAKAVQRRMSDALDQLYELNSDAAELGEVVHQRLPAFWKQKAEKWLSEEFHKARVVIITEAEVHRTGLSTRPRAVREKELIK